MGRRGGVGETVVGTVGGPGRRGWCAIDAFPSTGYRGRVGRCRADRGSGAAGVLPTTASFADGQDQEGGDPPQWIPGVDALRPIGDVVAQWRYETTLVDDPNSVPAEFEDSRFRWTVWHPRRIPIAGAYIWDYDNTYLDFIPGSTGTAGQVLTFTSEADMQVVGVSLSDALAKVIRLIERAQLTWDPNTGNLVPLTGAYAGHPADWLSGTIGRWKPFITSGFWRPVTRTCPAAPPPRRSSAPDCATVGSGRRGLGDRRPAR